jgi:signal transduction histidine kinase
MSFVTMRWLNSLGVKVLLAFVAGAVLSIILIVLGAVVVVNSQGDVLSAKAVAERTADLATKLRFDNAGNPAEFVDTVEGAFDHMGDDWQQESLKNEIAYRVLDASGNVVLSSAAGSLWPQSGVASPPERGRFEFERAGVAMRGATEAIEHEGTTWFLQFAASTRFLHLIYRDFALPFAGAGILLFSVVLLVVFGVCGYVTLRYTLKPLRRLSDAAAAISPQSLHARLPASGVPTELEPLVDSFNRALERLEQGYRVQQEFLATAAHELKTPLTLIRGQIELGVDEGNRQMLLRDVSHMGRQVQQLLHLAEASESQNYDFASVDAGSVAFEVADYLERLARRQGVGVQVDVEPRIPMLRADRGALVTLLKNLLENAIQHSPPGGMVWLDVKSDVISVRDEGPGMPPEDLPKLFTRFWRSAERRDVGAGLGLSICQEIATVHGWILSARRIDPGMVLELDVKARSGVMARAR